MCRMKHTAFGPNNDCSLHDHDLYVQEIRASRVDTNEVPPWEFRLNQVLIFQGFFTQKWRGPLLLSWLSGRCKELA